MKIKHKLLIAFLSLSLLPLLIVSWLLLSNASNELEQQAFNQLTSIKNIKKFQIEQYFKQSKADLNSIASSWQEMSAPHSSELAHSKHNYFKRFIENNDYYDLFIINPDGDVFYTVTKEADYQTNLRTGAYRNSGLGTLFNHVIASPNFYMADFAPYAPSNNDPAAFIAQPIIEQGELLAVVALQLSIEKINNIMALRDGMGESGETYLVGSDLRMRSNSYLDPDGRNVIASFRGSVERNGVNTAAVKNGLAGISNTEIVIDYNGNPVLSAYTPIRNYGLNWVLIAEIDEAEAFSAINKLTWFVSILLGFILVAVLVTIYFITKSIVTPLGGEPKYMQLISETIAKGDLTFIDDEAKHATGVLKAMHAMNTNLAGVIKELAHTSQSLYQTAGESSATSEQAKMSLAEQHENIASVSTAMTEMAVTIEEVANNARDAAEQTNLVSLASDDAVNSIEQVITVMRTLSEQLTSASDVIVQVEHKSQVIGTVLEVIQTITEQTNLLALNAAIEAARAGEQGRGFAVVADEVRELAKKTQESTRDIEKMISELQQYSIQAVDVIKRSDQIAAQTIISVQSGADSLLQVKEDIGLVAKNNELIATAATQQSIAAEEVNQSIHSINSAALENAAGAEQMASASARLHKLAVNLSSTVNQFKV